MQTNQPNAFKSASGRANRPIPGLKVAYGEKAQQQINQSNKSVAKPAVQNRPTATLGLLGMIKASVKKLTQKKSPQPEYPIGISQLTQTTFQATPNRMPTSFFRPTPAIQDYRFKQPLGPRPIPPLR